jgi:hypothetical protein
MKVHPNFNNVIPSKLINGNKVHPFEFMDDIPWMNIHGL